MFRVAITFAIAGQSTHWESTESAIIWQAPRRSPSVAEKWLPEAAVEVDRRESVATAPPPFRTAVAPAETVRVAPRQCPKPQLRPTIPGAAHPHRRTVAN